VLSEGRSSCSFTVLPRVKIHQATGIWGELCLVGPGYKSPPKSGSIRENNSNKTCQSIGYQGTNSIMSQTATLEASDGPRTVTLMNGSTFSFKSNISTTLDKIPVIDAARIWSESLEDRTAVAEEIREASRNIGFFYLINHVRSHSSVRYRGLILIL
jgi:hypothetical protein